MVERTEEFYELCAIVYKRNQLAKARRSPLNRVSYLRKIKSDKHNNFSLKKDRIGRHVPKKWNDMSNIDFHVELVKAELELTQARLNLSLFTQQTHKRLLELLKILNAKVSYQGGNTIQQVRFKLRPGFDGTVFMGREELERIHVDFQFENILLEA